MAYRLAISAVGGCVFGGAVFSEGVWRHAWKLAAAGAGLLATGGLGLVALVFLYAQKCLEARIKADFKEVDDRRRALDATMAEREERVRVREIAADRMRTVAAIRMASLQRRLDTVLDEKAQTRARLEAVVQELNEVLDEYNQLVTHELQLSMDQFTSRGYGFFHASRDYGALSTASDKCASGDVTPLRRKSDHEAEGIDTPISR
ncbi:hypothetical protein AB0912_15305 [Streptomyces sp. NPDC007084]|uniref:hypothetical protein n=1 Tax=Streptomyces sp. NPDC007084 TaxID=3154313 RepID=UPI00345217C5